MKYKLRFDCRFGCGDGSYKKLMQQVVVAQTDEKGAIFPLHRSRQVKTNYPKNILSILHYFIWNKFEFLYLSGKVCN
jgi:hypothetical protein